MHLRDVAMCIAAVVLGLGAACAIVYGLIMALDSALNGGG
jgi:hypothetical protein